MTSTLRALIVDDEPLARHRIRLMLAAHPDVKVSGECCDGREVLATLEAVKPDVVFLDIQMPDLDGFETLAHLGGAVPPAIVFVTAHETFARQAFDVHAVDYLVKPFSQERFDAALQRVRLFAGGAMVRPSAAAFAGRFAERLAVRTRSEVLFVQVSDLYWVSAEDNYARLHVAERSYLIRESLQYLETQLDPTAFIRVHRSAIVNAARLRKVVFNGNACALVLQNDVTVPLGARYRQRFEAFLGERL